MLKQRSGAGLAITTDWTKAETDHLFDLCDQFSLRFIVIADRFGLPSYIETQQQMDQMRKRDAKAQEKESQKKAKHDPLKFHERTVDELKDRYYSIAKAILE